MASYQAPLSEIQFVLNEVLKVERLCELAVFKDATPDTLSGLIDEAARLIEEKLAPLNASADAQGCVLEDGEITVPDGFTEFFHLYRDAGWVGISQKEEYGGAALPYTLGKVVEELLCSANVAFALYPGLTQGCFEALEASASDDIKKTYLPKLATGEWTGTMCITEPQAGSDIGAAKTRATPQADGSYRIDGGKIFITSGEHRMADNIVHFVLARLPDAPAGVKGLSTFVVPKFLVNADGSLGARNGVAVQSIEHKMGINGSVTCVLQFDGAQGWLVGEPNHGIQNMFVMMNLARIMVGFQGLGQCELATQNAIRYALDRKQGKAANGKAEIVEHPDVRRMLLQMKAMTEGARVLAYETAIWVDLARHHPDASVRETAQDWVELNTPLVKSLCTDAAFELGSMAIQVYGGHGFIKEHGVEQIVRDAKILCLYEGTNGIQAMDLVRRKLALHGGRLPQRFFDAVRADLTHAPASLAEPLKVALDALAQTTAQIQAQFKTCPDDAAFGCVDYQRAFALTYLGWNWLRMARAAQACGDAQWVKIKLATAQFFATRILPQVPALLTIVEHSAADFMALDANDFAA
ncbi:acyl-CoA dehydrogenase family protein [Sinimarinibacterium sp. NLF-5-8]|uniref:acyl-CoA dehydrogenase family protein n=1 Tax=Sinimarinibacterium sp. NLF-5-8 TaxID=2698684 RepID=UPI00137BA3E2|nr:acyl-CoA dehydrogenase family protein [Sinimarinibacterium sp. NLF-5-8]QHS09859.1 acyl-CoA dehydrogenase [Sinimarinibacterium sp. NLF-5-8]